MGLWTEVIFVTNYCCPDATHSLPTMAVAVNALRCPEREFDRHLKGTFCCAYAAKAPPGLRPVKMTVAGGATNHRVLTSGPLLTGVGAHWGMARHHSLMSKHHVVGCHVDTRSCGITRRTVFKSVFGGARCKCLRSVIQ